MKSHKFIDYTYLEIKSLIATGCMAVVPTGCTEQQGPHLPVGRLGLPPQKEELNGVRIQGFAHRRAF